MKKYFMGLDVNTQAEVVESVLLGSINLDDAADMISYDIFGCGICDLSRYGSYICKALAYWINGKYNCKLHLV